MNGNVVVRAFCHLSYILLMQFTSDDVKTSLRAKKCFPEIVHNTDSLKRGVLKGSSTIHENVQVTESSEQQAVELHVVVEGLVSDTSKQVSLVEVKIFGLKR